MSPSGSSGPPPPLVEQIASAVLYEGYLLYPYRASSVKNRQRWTFGGLYPEAYSRAQAGAEPSSMQTECLVLAAERPTIEVRVRFLHLLAREVGQLARPVPDLIAGAAPDVQPVERLEVGDEIFQTWQEAVEREVNVGTLAPIDLLDRPRRLDFSFPANLERAPVRGPDGLVVGIIRRSQQAIEGAVELSAEPVGERLFKVSIRILNLTPCAAAERQGRDEALLQSLVSTHTILGVRGGEFVSLLDPPEQYRAAAAGCRNVGTWPVLVGEEGQRDTMLSSPIILYDYPQIAPESPGDLFDGTEIDEILTLRILAMTDEEKREMRQVDERARALLDRTESLPPEQLRQLHGAMRSPRPLSGGTLHE